MAWIEVHQSLTNNHRKVLHLAELLGVPEAQAIGHLVCLWTWGVDNAEDGVLPASAGLIARAAKWTKKADRLVAALTEAHWLDTREDGRLEIHNWYEFVGRLIEQRKAEAARKRSIRAKTQQSTIATEVSGGRPADVPGTSGGRPGDVRSTNQTNRTNPTNRTNQAAAIGTGTDSDTETSSRDQAAAAALLDAEGRPDGIRWPYCRRVHEAVLEAFGRPLFGGEVAPGAVGVLEKQLAVLEARARLARGLSAAEVVTDVLSRLSREGDGPLLPVVERAVRVAFRDFPGEAEAAPVIPIDPAYLREEAARQAEREAVMAEVARRRAMAGNGVVG